MNKRISAIICIAVALFLTAAGISLMIPGNITDLYKTDGYKKSIDIPASGYQYTIVDGVFQATGDDPQFVLDVSNEPQFKFVRIDVSGIRQSVRCQVFWADNGEDFSGNTSTQKLLSNGTNVFEIPNGKIVILRFDLADNANVKFNLKSITLTNNWYVPPIVIVILFAISLFLSLCLFDKLAFNFKYTKTIFARLFQYGDDNSKLSGFVVRQSRSLFNRSKLFWICTGLTSILCFAFTIANLTITIDDEFVLNQYIGLSQLRWGYDLINSILGTTTALPTFSKIIAVCELIIGVLIWVKLFEKISNKKISEVALTLFSCTLLASPFIASLNAWVFCSVNYFLAFSVAGMCANFFLKIIEGNKRFLNVLLFILIGCLPNDYGYGVIAVGGCTVLLFCVIYDYKKINLWAYIKHLIVLVILTGSVVVADKLIGKFLAVILGVKVSNYQDNYFSWNFSNGIFNGLVDGVKNINYILKDTIGVIEVCLIIICIVIFFAISLKRKNVVPLFAFLCFSGSSFALSFLTANFQMAARVRFPEAFLLAVLLLLVYETFSKIQFCHIVPMHIPVLIVCVVLITNLCRVSNMIHQQHYLLYQFDTSLMRQISYDIGEIDPTRTKPVTFLGSIVYSNSRYNESFVNGATVNSYFTWDRHMISSETQSGRISNFFNFHGYTFNIGCFDTEENLRQEYDEMPVYPQDGYVEDCGEYILVKLGDNTNLPALSE